MANRAFAASTVRLYVDGVLGDGENSTEVAPTLTTAKGPLEIGCGVFGAGFKGRIDEVRIYNRALSPIEIEPDTLGPTPPTVFDATYEGDPAAITWNRSMDPPNPSRDPGTVVANYSYRYQ